MTMSAAAIIKVASMGIGAALQAADVFSKAVAAASVDNLAEAETLLTSARRNFSAAVASWEEAANKARRTHDEEALEDEAVNGDPDTEGAEPEEEPEEPDPDDCEHITETYLDEADHRDPGNETS